MSLPSVVAPMDNATNVHQLSRINPVLGLSLGEMDYLRGWKDDFHGHTIDPSRYAFDTAGVGSLSFRVNHLGFEPSGWMRGTSGPGAGRYSRVWLGNAIDTRPSLDADFGWAMAVRWRIDVVGSSAMRFGAGNVGGTREIVAGYNSGLGANWIVTCTDGGGASTTAAATGPAIDTSYWMGLNVTDTEVNLTLNGALIVTHTTNIPGDLLTPEIFVVSNAGNTVKLDVDVWGTMPREQP